MAHSPTLWLAAATMLAACAPTLAPGGAALTGAGLAVQIARVHVDPADPLSTAEAGLSPPGPGDAHRQPLLIGHPTRLSAGPTAKGLLLALASPELDTPVRDLDLRLEGAVANAPATVEGDFADPPPPAGPSCVLPDATAVEGAVPFRLLAVALPAPLGDSASFWVIRAGLPAPADQAFDEVEVACRRVASGEHCQVYLDGRLAASGSALAGALALQTAFDARIYPTVTGLFGAAPSPGLNGDGKVLVVISDEVSGRGKTSTLAYFGRRDLAERDPAVPAHRRSNEREILFVDAATLTDERRVDLLTAVAHEFQHLVNAHHKLGISHLAQGEATWLDEALAMYASAACGYGVNESRAMYAHVAAYLDRSYKYSLTDWAGNPGRQGYGIGYLFMTYLAERFGPAIVTDLVASPLTGKANLEAQLATRGSSYRQAFADWTVALASDGLFPDDTHRFSYQTLHPRGETPFGTFKGPTAIRVGPLGIHVPHRADVALLLHFQLPSEQSELVVRAAGGPFLATALVP